MDKIIAYLGLSDGEGGVSARRVLGYASFAGIAILVMTGKLNLDNANHIWAAVSTFTGVVLSIGLDSFAKPKE